MGYVSLIIHMQNLVSGRPAQGALPPLLLSAMESFFGVDLGHIRLGIDSPLPAKIGADAFASGNQIHFAPGVYNPASASGWRVIGHEVAHIVQQARGLVTGGREGETFLVDDPQLELQAETAGNWAAAMWSGWRPRCPFPIAAPSQGRANGFPIQCLMTWAEFKTASSASGFRSNIQTVDTALKTFHEMSAKLAKNPGTQQDYADLLKQINKLYDACILYKKNSPTSPRINGVNKLIRQITFEQGFLAFLARPTTSVVEQFDALDEAFEHALAMERKHGLDFTRRGASMEVLTLLRGLEQPMQRKLADDVTALMEADVERLKQLIKRGSLPAVLKDVIEEVTDTANILKVDFMFAGPGASPNLKEYGVRFSLKNSYDQSLGRKWRLGALLHELTHISTMLKFRNLPLMLAVPTDATDDEMVAFATKRKLKITTLIDIIEQSDFTPTIKSEFKSKAEYAISTKLGLYLETFGKLMKEKHKDFYDRLMALVITKKKMNAELVEYDTVINQMTLWCYLMGTDPSHPVFAKLLVLAREAYNWRAQYDNGNGGMAYIEGAVRQFG
jgi:hypothetical protein